jgi:hypothetical protein
VQCQSCGSDNRDGARFCDACGAGLIAPPPVFESRKIVTVLFTDVVHLILIAVFFTWAGRGLGKAFKLPSSSKLLLIFAVVVAIAGIVLATRPGRRFAAGKLIPG